MEKKVIYSIVFIVIILTLLLTNLLRPIYGFFLAFFLPGFALSLVLFKKQPSCHRIAYSIGLSLIILIVNGFFLNLFKAIQPVQVIFSLSLITMFFFSARWLIDKPDFPEIRLNLKQRFKNKYEIFKLSFLFATLIFTFLNVYRPHFNYPYPFHADEWSHLTGTVVVLDSGTLDALGTNPQVIHKLGGHLTKVNLGFHVITSQFFAATDLDIVLFFKYLPALFALFSVIILFTLLYRITGKYWIGVFSIILFNVLRTNDNTLGVAFIVGLTMTFPLIYFMILNFAESFHKLNIKYLIIACLAYFSVLTIHEQTGASFAPIIFLYIVFNVTGPVFKLMRKRPLLSLSSVLIPLASFYVAKDILWRETWQNSFEGFINLITWEGKSFISFPYHFLFFYGILMSLLAVIGVIYAIRNKKYIIFIVMAFVTLFQVYLFRTFTLTYFSFIGRLRHHATISLIPLSAMGLYAISKFVFLKLKNLKYSHVIKGICLSILMTMLMVLIFIRVDTGEYLPKSFNLGSFYPSIQERDYKAIKWLGENYESRNVVLAKETTSVAIYPITRNYIVGSWQASGNSFGSRTGTWEIRKFFLTHSCIEKLEIIKRSNVDFVLSESFINCDFLEKVYYEDFRYVYKVV